MLFNDSKTFNPVYWASKDPDVRALESIQDHDARLSQAALLATQGHVVDYPVDALGNDPFTTMSIRQYYGYTWVPSALQANINVAPGLTAPGMTPYDPNKPIPGSIKVSLDSADYPAFVVPVPPTVFKSLVGDHLGGNIYEALGVLAKDGEKYTVDVRGTFTFHRPSLFGYWFTKD